MHEFQIVNGGQATTTFASSARKEASALAGGLLPMKLGFVPAERVAGLVPRCSPFANTHNRVQDADYHATHPWHITLQKLSRTTRLPPTLDSPRGIRLFYERPRGQYADGLAATGTAVARKRCRAQYSAKQKLNTTDLGK